MPIRDYDYRPKFRYLHNGEREGVNMPFHSDIVFDPSLPAAVTAAGVAFAAMASRVITRKNQVRDVDIQSTVD
jgi:hypothetical protein